MYKIPVSVLVVIYRIDLQVLVLERADHVGFWQSVTGSCDTVDEPLVSVAKRETFEETGLDYPLSAFQDWQHVNQYEIYPHWRHRYAPGVTHNHEHCFSLCVSDDDLVRLNPREHLQYSWLPWQVAAERCFSMSNVQAIYDLPRRVHHSV